MVIMEKETVVPSTIPRPTPTSPLDQFLVPNSADTPRKSRVEINLIRLLTKTEEMSKEATPGGEGLSWRFVPYVSHLEVLINDLRIGPNPPDRDTLQNYTRRVDFLKGLINILSPQSSESIGSPDSIDSNGMTNIARDSFLLSPLGPTTSPTSPTGQIRQRHKVKLLDEMRRELFGTGTGDDQIDSNSPNTPSDVNELLKYHHSLQERIAEQMLDLTRNLKEQAVVAGTIVKQDTETLERATNQMDKNTRNLALESQKLEMFNRRACKCWIWVMLILVCTIFISMVLFMRLFKKTVRSS